MDKSPIVNCHTHIFTSAHVPPFLAKKILPWPFYLLFSLRWIVWLFKQWYDGPYEWQFQPWYKRTVKVLYQIKIMVVRSYILSALYLIIGLWLMLSTLYILVDILREISPSDSKILHCLAEWKEQLISLGILIEDPGNFASVMIVLSLFLFFPAGRNIVYFILKKIWSFLAIVPGKATKELAARYVNLGRFAFHDKQNTIFQRLRDQYPRGTGFIVLPMDMEYMEAGGVKEKYRDQMNFLATMKSKKSYDGIFYPFVFIDPRRIVDESDFFTYRLANGRVVLGDCFVKDFIETKKFSGFKIYPALGYYPFDENLLPLWKYAADNEIPIMTHCIRGTIFYRGAKKKEWDAHPVFQQCIDDNEIEPLLLPEMKNMEFSINFTHPLNYLCLLHEPFLRKLVGKSNSEKLRETFGYSNEHTPLIYNLEKLKICFAHFGGDDEWKRFFELDRNNYSNHVIKYPDRGIEFYKNTDGTESIGKIEHLWKYVDWYSIICSMMIRYDNIYSDISYISHDDYIHSLLKRTLSVENAKLRTRVLFGTDFYVVRNHKSEKNILSNTIAGLSEEEFNLIARENPQSYLRRK